MREIQVNMAYRWFLGYDLDETIPDHSVLSKARARFGMEVFEHFFKYSIELCQKAGLLAEGPVYVDTTLVQAAASMDSLRERNDSIRPPLPIREYVKRLYTENAPAAQAEPVPCPAPPATKCSDADTKVPPRYRRIRPDGHRRKANNELVSRTDPEATVVSRRGFGLHLAYKAHVAVAGAKGQVITAAMATTGAKADEHLLGDMLRYHSSLSGLPVKEIVADAKYGTMTNYEFLQRAGITAFIPPRQRISQPRGVWGKDRFRYLREEDVFLCPAGMRMKHFTRRNSTQRVAYKVERGVCVSCEFREQCAPSGRERTISRLFEQKLVEEAKERLSSPRGQELLLQRKVSAEGVFASAKELHGLRRTRFMGRWKVQIQLWLTAAAINIKKALKQLQRIELAENGTQANISEVSSADIICLVNFVKDIADCIYYVLSGLQKHFGNSPSEIGTLLGQELMDAFRLALAP